MNDLWLTKDEWITSKQIRAYVQLQVEFGFPIRQAAREERRRAANRRRGR